MFGHDAPVAVKCTELLECQRSRVKRMNEPEFQNEISDVPRKYRIGGIDKLGQISLTFFASEPSSQCIGAQC